MSDNIIARNKIEIAVDGSGVDAGIAKIDRSIKGLSRSAADAGKQASKGIGEIGNGGVQASANVDKATKNIINSIQRQTAAFTAGKRGSAEYYQSIASLKGANLDALKPYISQLKDAQIQADKLALANGKVTSSLGGMGGQLSITKNLIGGLAATIASISFVGATRSALDFADSINDVAVANDVAISSILKLSGALQLNGGQSESAGRLFSSLTSKLDEAADGSEKAQKQFAKVGVSLQDLKTLDGQALFEKTLLGLGAIEDPIKRNATAMDLFGKAVKGVDIKGLANDFESNKNTFAGAEKSFKDTALAMDKLDAFTDKFKTTLATLAGGPLIKAIEFTENYGTSVLKNIPIMGRMVDLMERYVIAQNAAAGNVQVGKIRPADGKAPAIREVTDANAESIKKGNDTAAKAQQDAIKKAKEAREKAFEDLQKSFLDEDQLAKDMAASKIAVEEMLNKRMKDLDDATQKLKDEAYKKDLERVAKLQDIANTNFQEAQRESQRLEDDRVKEFEKSMSDINGVFRDGFAEMVNGGKGSWKSFTRSLVTTFKTTVADAIYKMFAQPFVAKIAVSILGVTGSTAASAGTLSSLTQEGGSIFGTISDGLGSLNTNVVGSIEKLGTFLSNGQGGLGDKIGGFLGENASTISSALAFSGAALSLLKGDIKGAAFQGGGAAIGLALGGPVGGAIGSFLGGALGGLFGGGLPPRATESRSGTFKSGSFKAFEGADVGKRTVGVANSLDSLNKQFSQNVGSLLSSFGLNQTISTNSLLTKKKNTRARFNASVGGVAIGEYEESFGKKGTFEQAFQSLLNNVLGSATVKAFQASALPKEIKRLFSGFSDKTQVANLINATISLNSAQKELADSFGITVNQSAAVATSTGLVGQSLVDFVTKLATTATATKTIGQVLVEAKDKLLEAADIDVFPDTLKAFDLALKNIDKTTQTGIEQFANQFNQREQFIAITSSLDSLKNGVKGALFGVVSDTEKQAMLQADLAKAFGELNIQVPGSIAELIALGNELMTESSLATAEGLNLAAVFPSLVTAFTDTQSAVDSLINSLRDISEFSTLVDFKRYKGLASNYGTSFANNVTDGQTVTYGNSNNTSVSVNPVTASNNTSISTSDPNMLNAMTTLIARVDALQLAVDKSATHSKRAADVLVNVSPNGNAIQTEAA